MQDKYTHISNKMTSRGWTEMSEMLDREMPAPAKKRRRFGWWWLALGLSVGLASGVFAVKYFSQKEEVKHQPTVPVAALPETGQPALTDPAAARFSPETPSDNDAAAAIPENSVSNILPEKAVAIPPVFTQKNRKEAQPATPAPLVFEKNTLAATTPEKPATAEIATPAEQAGPARLQPVPAESLAFPALSEFPAVSASAPAATPNLSAANRWTTAVYGSGLSSPSGNSGGLAAGLQKSTALKNTRFELEGGAGYAYLQQPLSVIFTSDQGTISTSTNNAFNNFSTVLGDNRISTTSSSSESAAKLLKTLHLHYLEVPLAASYRFTSRFSIKAGMNAAFLLSSSSDYTTGGLFGNTADLSNLQKDEAEASFDYNGEQSSVRLNNFDLAATTGFDYRISPRFTAGLGYQFGLMDLIPDNNSGDFNRMLRLTLRYNFRIKK